MGIWDDIQLSLIYAADSLRETKLGKRALDAAAAKIDKAEKRLDAFDEKWKLF